ncbi:MAG: SPFH domain-containing protein [Cytophagales bacterium]|nr:MAG: SPFH domain-containing protein [Cytophagales bacterium]
MQTLEKNAQPMSGYTMLFNLLALLGISIAAFVVGEILQAGFLSSLLWIAGLFIILAVLVLAIGFFAIAPNGSVALVLFGDYKGTVKQNGFFWSNPFFMRTKVSLRAHNFESDRLKVNDKLGNPITISAILVWQVEDTYKALFEVDKYENFVKLQADAALRKLAGLYPYDNLEDHGEVTLRSGTHEVNHQLEAELSERLHMAGIKVVEARIGYLAYATEIAQAMLRKQQATAIIAARQKIVEGAVTMVEMALAELSKKQIIELDEDKKAAMVSNLMVVLCSDKDASPVINTGTLHQ